MRSNFYTVTFAFFVCIILSVLLSGTSALLKDQQLANQKIDRQKNILSVAGITAKNSEDVELYFSEKVESFVVNKDGKAIKEESPDKIKDPKLFPVYYIKSDNGSVYVYPIEGKGLWSTMYGYLAVSSDGREIRGITFYKQGETPGLGAEVEKEWFVKNFVGKKLYDGEKFVGVEVVKGKAKNNSNFKTRKDHMVDGISGATLTCDGVTKMLRLVPKKYEPFFASKRG